MARNFDDFLQRDLKAHTFLRSFCVWTLSTTFLLSTTRISQRLIPIGRYGIRKFNETQFYQNFGWIGVAGVGAWWFGAAYFWWKCTRFTVNKFYSHVLLQNRNWIHENLEVSNFGRYIYPEQPLCEEDAWGASKERRAMVTNSLPEIELTYYGPYTVPQKTQ